MKSKLVILLLSLLFVSGCDIPWGAIGNVVGVSSGGGESWWDKNDEHWEWMIWPVNEFF